MIAEHTLADAFRTVALRLEQSIESGHISPRRPVTYNDLLETLLAVADLADPPFEKNATPERSDEG